MPKWSNTPPDENDGFALRILRAPADKPLIGIITSTDSIGCCTHFVANRTIPCDAPDPCKPCQDGYSWRWHGYLACIIPETLEHILFEFTARASETFKHYQTLHTTLRGCHFKAIRPSKRFNGRVVISCKPHDQTRLRLPDPPNIQKVLCHIWNIPYQETPTTIDPERLGRQMEVPGQAERHQTDLVHRVRHEGTNGKKKSQPVDEPA